MLEPGLPKVHLIVDHPGQEPGAVGVEDLRAYRCRLADAGDPAVLDEQITLRDGPLVDDPGVADQVAVGHEL